MGHFYDYLLLSYDGKDHVGNHILCYEVKQCRDMRLRKEVAIHIL